MATIGTIKNEIHVATGADLVTLKNEADVIAVATPAHFPWLLHHVYREYNKRRFFYSAGSDMITPYDGGFTPISYTPAAGGDVLLLESGDDVLLEDGDNILLE